MNIIKKHLSNHFGELHAEHLVIIVIAFIAGAILIGSVWAALDSGFANGMNTSINDFLN